MRFALKFALSLCALFPDARKVVSRTKADIKVLESSWGTIILKMPFIENIMEACSRKCDLVKREPLAGTSQWTQDTKNKQRKGPRARDTQPAHTTGISNLRTKSAAAFLTKAHFHWRAGVAHGMLPQSRGDAKAQLSSSASLQVILSYPSQWCYLGVSGLEKYWPSQLYSLKRRTRLILLSLHPLYGSHFSTASNR